MPLVIPAQHARILRDALSGLNELLGFADFPGRGRFVHLEELHQLERARLMRLNVHTVHGIVPFYDEDVIGMFAMAYPRNTEAARHPPGGHLVIFQVKEVTPHGSYILHASYSSFGDARLQTVRYLPQDWSSEEWQMKREHDLPHDLAQFFIYGVMPDREHIT